MSTERLHKALCALHKSTDHEDPRPVLCEITLGPDESELPEWLMLIPAGRKKDGLIKARDGREFYNSDPEAILTNFKKNKQDIPLDIEHATEIRAPFGEPAPAIAWIPELEVRKGAVWGRMEWNWEGGFNLRSRAYRYLSPAFFHNDEGVIVQITSAGLTNRPALIMPAVAHNQGAKKMDPELLEMLGLDENATQEQVNAAVKAMKAEQASGEEKVQELSQELETANASLQTVNAELTSTKTELKKAREATPGLDQFVPRADYDALKQSVTSLQSQVEAQTASTQQQKIDAAIAQALTDGKITPSTEEYHRKCCAQEGGLENFLKFVETAPAVAPTLTNFNDPPPNQGEQNATPDALRIAQLAGVSKEDFQKAL